MITYKLEFGYNNKHSHIQYINSINDKSNLNNGKKKY